MILGPNSTEATNDGSADDDSFLKDIIMMIPARMKRPDNEMTRCFAMEAPVVY